MLQPETRWIVAFRCQPRNQSSMSGGIGMMELSASDKRVLGSQLNAFRMETTGLILSPVLGRFVLANGDQH